MNMRAALMVSCSLLTATPALASVHDILIGLDQKVAYDANGQQNAAPGNDSVLIMDVSNPARPKIRASLPLMNSLLGPPTNLQITAERDGSAVFCLRTLLIA